MFNRFYKGLLISVAVSISLVNFTPAAAEAPAKDEVVKKYPPYPEVWGYDISDYQAVQDNNTLISAYSAPDGEIIFTFVSEDTPYGYIKDEDFKEKRRYKAIKFFEGKIIDIGTSKDRGAFVKDNHLKRIGGASITLKDGTVIKREYGSTGRFCPDNSLVRVRLVKSKPETGDGYIGKYAKDAERFSIIGAMPNIFRFRATKGEDPCPRSAEINYRQLYFLPGEFIQLEDDTFIAYETDKNLIIRFDRNIDTKFKPQHGIKGTKIRDKNFFVIPYSVIEALNQKVLDNDEEWIQGAHDRLLKYLEQQETSTQNKQ